MPQVNIEMDGPVAIVRFTNPPDGFMDGKTVPEITAMLDQLREDEGFERLFSQAVCQTCLSATILLLN